MEKIALFEIEFHHEGRGPELQRVVWSKDGITLKGFEYYNPDDVFEEENIKHLELVGLEAYSVAGEEVHSNIIFVNDSKAAIFKVLNSPWLKQFNPLHLKGCDHYQIRFYDEIYDVICREIKTGQGRIIND